MLPCKGKAAGGTGDSEGDGRSLGRVGVCLYTRCQTGGRATVGPGEPRVPPPLVRRGALSHLEPRSLTHFTFVSCLPASPARCPPKPQTLQAHRERRLPLAPPFVCLSLLVPSWGINRIVTPWSRPATPPAVSLSAPVSDLPADRGVTHERPRPRHLKHGHTHETTQARLARPSPAAHADGSLQSGACDRGPTHKHCCREQCLRHRARCSSPGVSCPPTTSEGHAR